MSDRNIMFMTVVEFKEQIGSATLSVLKNPKTGKLFLTASDGTCFRVQQDIDKTKEMKILVEDLDFTNACLVNVENGAEKQFEL